MTHVTLTTISVVELELRLLTCKFLESNIGGDKLLSNIDTISIVMRSL